MPNKEWQISGILNHHHSSLSAVLQVLMLFKDGISRRVLEVSELSGIQPTPKTCCPVSGNQSLETGLRFQIELQAAVEVLVNRSDRLQ